MSVRRGFGRGWLLGGKGRSEADFVYFVGSDRWLGIYIYIRDTWIEEFGVYRGYEA